MFDLIRKHDVGVLAGAAVLLALAWLWDHGAGAAPMKTVEKGRVSLQVPASWLLALSDETGVNLRGEDALTMLEIRIDDKPKPDLGVSVDAKLELDRGQRFGQLYQREESGTKVVGGQEWLRTQYSYAFKPGPTHAPRIASAVEYAYPADAKANGDKLYVVTLQGSEDRVKQLEPAVLGTLVVKP